MKLIAIPIFLLLLTGSHILPAQNKGEKVLYENTFEVDDNALLTVNHKFGKVVFNNWEKDAVSVKVTARWRTKNESKVQAMLDRVELEIRGTAGEVSILCKPGRQSGSDKNLELDLVIFMPESVSLRLKQKFGLAFIEKVSGEADISSEYGNLKINELNGRSKIRLAFGDGSAQHLTAGSLRIRASGFKVNTAGNLDLESSYSDISITQKVRELKADMEGGNLEAGKVEMLFLRAKYANIEVDRLAQSMDIESAYGSVDVAYVSNDFDRISVENSYGSVDITIAAGASYTFQAESHYGEIDYPTGVADFSYEKKTVSGVSYKGVIGKGKPTGEVRIENNFGNVSINR